MKKKSMMPLWPAIALLWVLTGCSSYTSLRAYKKMPDADRKWADSLLLYALDHEALYTLLDTLKPISSVQMYRLPLLPDSTLPKGKMPPAPATAALDSLERLGRICRALSNRKIAWVLIPFRQADYPYRNLQVYVVRQLVLQQKIAAYPGYFAPYGMAPVTPAAAAITQVEHMQAYDRWRGYGFLFGYPLHAVNFFVEAGKSQDSTKKFVERQFFNIPVYGGNSGYFTYALPKTYTPAEADSAIYRVAAQTLSSYKALRAHWLRRKTLPVAKIWRRINGHKEPLLTGNR
ncbi:MAG: hypothetical protein MUF24_08515 [Chitinophagaceae bacterium]|jgi:hypothetical protein|nr:hypothetical protein [Chitinophagaceae bacterium]